MCARRGLPAAVQPGWDFCFRLQVHDVFLSLYQSEWGWEGAIWNRDPASPRLAPEPLCFLLPPQFSGPFCYFHKTWLQTQVTVVFLWHGGRAVSKVTTSVIHGWGFLDSKWSGTWGPAIDGDYGSARTNPRQGPFHLSTHVRQAPYSCPPDQPRGRWEVTAFFQVHSFIQHLFMRLLSACLGLGYPKGKATRVGSSFRA